MYAIVEIKGKQYKVEKGQEVYVDLLGKKEGSKIDFKEVLLFNDGKKTSVGQPFVKGVTVKAKIEKEVKGRKIIVFKFKPKKGHRKKKGHRQKYHKITIKDIAKAAATADAK